MKIYTVCKQSIQLIKGKNDKWKKVLGDTKVDRSYLSKIDALVRQYRLENKEGTNSDVWVVETKLMGVKGHYKSIDNYLVDRYYETH